MSLKIQVMRQRKYQIQGLVKRRLSQDSSMNFRTRGSGIVVLYAMSFAKFPPFRCPEVQGRRVGSGGMSHAQYPPATNSSLPVMAIGTTPRLRPRKPAL